MSNALAAVAAMDLMLDQISDCLDAEAARRIVAMQITPAIQARVEVLAERSNEGLLTDQEREEYKSFVEMSDLIAILKRKARRILATGDRP